MNPEIKKQWLEALRSREYVQGKDYLQNNNQFCCLGVLCDLHRKEKNISWKFDSKYNAYTYLAKVYMLPSEVSKWAGINSPDIKLLDYRGNEKCITDLNDDGMPFEDIANLIEEQL